MDDPSNIRPSVKTSASNVSTGTVKCWIVPGRSQNLTSMNSTFSASMKLRTSSALLNDINPACTGRAYVGLTPVILAACGLDLSCPQFPASVPDVSLVLRVQRVPLVSHREARARGRVRRDCGSDRPDTVVLCLMNPGTRVVR